MNQKRLLIFLSLLAIAILITLASLHRASRPDLTASSSSSTSQPTSQAGAPSSANPAAAGISPQRISGLPPRQPQTASDPALPSDGYFFDLSAPHAGQLVIASVTIGPRTHKLSPNITGDFQRVIVSPRQSIPITLTYPEAKPGDTVVVQAMDGGAIRAPPPPTGIDHDMVRLLTLDTHRTAQTTFQVSDNKGTHRLVLTKGADKKVLDFWVADP